MDITNIMYGWCNDINISYWKVAAIGIDLFLLNYLLKIQNANNIKRFLNINKNKRWK